jgi:hypothetical protein
VDSKVDLRSVSVGGKYSFGRARVLWSDGLLQVHTLDGLRLEVTSERPVRRRGFRFTWDVKTSMGDLVLSIKCVTCGGRPWVRFVTKPFQDLWTAT